MTKKERAEYLASKRPWTQDASKTFRYSRGNSGAINSFPEHKPDPFNDTELRLANETLRRQGWHHHIKSGNVTEGLQDRKAFKPAQGVSHTKLTKSVIIMNARFGR